MNKSNAVVIKPWGQYIVIEKDRKHWIKKLFVQKSEQFSLQSHKHRFEIWVVLSGSIDAIKGEQQVHLRKGEFLRIEMNEKHRVHALEDSWILEIAFGNVLEDDIKRYEDVYGRV